MCLPMFFRTGVLVAAGMGLLSPLMVAQGAPGGSTSRSTRPSRPAPRVEPYDMVLSITGKVETHDGSPVPYDAVVERVCNGVTRQRAQVRSDGGFIFNLDSTVAGLELDASAGVSVTPRDSAQGGFINTSPRLGVNRRDLAGCQLQVVVPRFRSSSVDLARRFDGVGGNINVGTIFVQPGEKPLGTTLSATAFQAPKKAKKAYEKGVQAARNGKLSEAQGFLQEALQVYPRHAAAWLELGSVFEQQNRIPEARKAFTEAISADPSFVPPYLHLALIAAHERNWTEVLSHSKRALELDPLTYPIAYFCQAVANYNLNNLAAAEEDARQAERLDPQHRIPRLHLLLADILEQKKDYHNAIEEMRIYLRVAPAASDADGVKARLASLEKLNSAVGKVRPD